VADERLAELERSVEAGGPGARLEYAHALERVGRKDESLQVLLGGLDQAEVRTALAARPAWSHHGGPAGGSGWLDVAPLRADPRLRWAQLPHEPTPYLDGGFVVSELGVVTTCPPVQGVWILDPRDGAERRVVFTGTIYPVLAGAALLLPRGVFGPQAGTEVRSLLDGSLLRTIELSAPAWAGHRLVSLEPDGCRAYALDDLWREAPQPRWTIPCSQRAGVHPLPWGLVVDYQRTCRVYDAEGDLAWTRPDLGRVLADAHGVAGLTSRGVELLDTHGVRLWLARRERQMVSLLAPDWLLVRAVQPWALQVLDRTSGDVRATLPLEESVEVQAMAAARDVIYLSLVEDGQPTLLALSIEGDVLWRREGPEGLAQVQDLAPLDGLLFGRCQDGTVFCLEQTP
jgi:hypothetical protein